MFGYPARDPLPHLQFEAIDGFRMGILRGAQHEFIILQHVDKTGIAPHHRSRKIHDFGEHLLERRRGATFRGALQRDILRLFGNDFRQKLNVPLVFFELAGRLLQRGCAFSDQHLELAARLLQLLLALFFQGAHPTGNQRADHKHCKVANFRCLDGEGIERRNKKVVHHKRGDQHRKKSRKHAPEPRAGNHTGEKQEKKRMREKGLQREAHQKCGGHKK